ncbi:hypothetical protein PR048_013365 [Dryococelus australis]|uniref:Uncharacterized protein n=1 Tax=Dryococelus australis TaxID=614101 RepID=A0ABQ9HS98_9NEOP|nr:hypothetical protein PR048_013365 [Dryococelus australis]
MKDLISVHLVFLKDEIGCYFPDVSSESWQCQLTRDPLNIKVDILSNFLQEQAINLKCDSQTKVEFANMNLKIFESGFSILAYINSKYRARLDVKSDLRFALSQLTPNIQKLVKEKQYQLSH